MHRGDRDTMTSAPTNSTNGDRGSRSHELVPIASGGKRDQLLMALQEYQASQNQLTLANSRAAAYSVMMGLANRAENQRLATQQQLLARRLREGEQVLFSLKEQVDEQSDSLDNLSGQVQEQDGSIRTLEDKVEIQRKHLENLAKEYQEELASQREMLEKHKHEFGKLLLSKLKQDAMLDSGIMLFSYLLVQTPFVNLPIKLMSLIAGAFPVVPIRNRQQRIAYVSRIATLLFVARALRIVAARRGFHNSVGTPIIYANHVINFIQQTSGSSSIKKEE